MRNKGFTLIELLAVIVILAIIALIAVPIITDIINDTKKKGEEISLQNYFKAVENAIAREELNGKFNYRKCEIGAEGNLVNCDGAGENVVGLEVEVDGDVPTEGTLYFADKTIVNYKGLTIGNAEFTKQICKAVTQETATKYSNDSNKNIGNVPKGDGTFDYKDEYICEVGPGIEQRFFVGRRPDEGEDKVILIMDSNINKNGEAVKSNSMTDKGIVAWNSELGVTDNTTGPITAIEYLQQATQNWVYLEQMTVIEFKDRWNTSYKLGGDQQPLEYKMYARLPQLADFIKSPGGGSDAFYYVNYLEGPAQGENAEYDKALTHVDGITGFLVSDVYNYGEKDAVRVHYWGHTGNTSINESVKKANETINFGVRPVIEVSKDQIS